MREEMSAGQELLKEEMLAQLDANHERMFSRVDSQLEKMEVAVEANQEEVNATDLETNPGELESEAEHEDVSKEEATVEMIGALKERCGDWHIAVGRRRRMEKRTQGNGETRKKLAVARIETTRHAGATRCKGRNQTGPTVEEGQQKNRTRDNVARGRSKGRTFEKRRRAQPKCNNGIKN
jgi:hypothetical protein